MPGSTASTRPGARAGQSSRLPVGPSAAQVLRLGQDHKAPIAIEAVTRIDALFAIEREINGLAQSQRVGVRTERSRRLILALETWLREQRGRVSKHSDTGNAIEYSLNRWTALNQFLDDGHLCMTNNAAERELRAIAIGRRNWTFAGSDEGGR